MLDSPGTAGKWSRAWLGATRGCTLQAAVAAVETVAAYPASMGIAIKGRGSTSHLAGRFESTVREAVDDGWAVDESEEFLAPRLRTEPVGESVSRLRAWLLLLLCASLACLSEPVTGPGFRDQAVRQDQCAAAAAQGAVEAGLRATADRAGHQHRRVPTDRTQVQADPPADRSDAGDETSVLADHQERTGRARHRSACTAGRGKPGQRAFLGDLAGPASLGQAGTARIGTACTAARDEAAA
ncbi:hypothetical protein G6F32_013851 [Rhizopus arrhizus]|nr:hypothetical protein G6F32_013851 [Rhizopus arrhizus]